MLNMKVVVSCFRSVLLPVEFYVVGITNTASDFFYVTSNQELDVVSNKQKCRQNRVITE